MHYTEIFVIGIFIHLVPFQNSIFFVLILNPIIPSLGLFGLPALFQLGIFCWNNVVETAGDLPCDPPRENVFLEFIT